MDLLSRGEELRVAVARRLVDILTDNIRDLNPFGRGMVVFSDETARIAMERRSMSSPALLVLKSGKEAVWQIPRLKTDSRPDAKGNHGG